MTVACLVLLSLVGAATLAEADGQQPGGTMRSTRRVLVDFGGRSLSFCVTDGTEPTILLEAGMGQDSTEWKAVQAELARRVPCRIVSYDRAGFGGSTPDHTAYDIEREVASLAAALDALGAQHNVVYVAHSYGAFLAQVYALRHADRVRGMVLVDPNTVAFNDGGGLEAFWPPRSWDEVAPANVRVMQAYPATIAYLRKIPAYTTVAAPLVVVTAGRSFLPTMELSALWRKCHENLVKDWPHRALRVAEGSSHLIPVDEPASVCDAVVEVLSGVPPQRE